MDDHTLKNKLTKNLMMFRGEETMFEGRELNKREERES